MTKRCKTPRCAFGRAKSAAAVVYGHRQIKKGRKGAKRELKKQFTVQLKKYHNAVNASRQAKGKVAIPFKRTKVGKKVYTVAKRKRKGK